MNKYGKWKKSGSNDEFPRSGTTNMVSEKWGSLHTVVLNGIGTRGSRENRRRRRKGMPLLNSNPSLLISFHFWLCSKSYKILLGFFVPFHYRVLMIYQFARKTNLFPNKLATITLRLHKAHKTMDSGCFLLPFYC